MTNSAPGFAKHPNHAVSISKANGPVSITTDGKEIARSENAKLLNEASYPPVYYIPLEDIPTSLLRPSENSTYCPFKGNATYWDLTTETGLKQNAIWSYREPYDEAMDIKDYVAFYPDAANVTPV